MARESQDREDLLRDATAFVSRVQLQVILGEQPVVVFAGFRAQGAASFYFDQDPVYHFNSVGQLRRAFVDDLLVKAEAGRLVRLRRQRGEHESAMIRNVMTAGEQQTFCQKVGRELHQLLEKVAAGEYDFVGQVVATTNENVLALLTENLKQLVEIKIADSPRVGG